MADFYPEAKWQRCGSPVCQPPLFPSASSVVHWYRNVWTAVPSGKVKEVAAMLKAIHARQDLEAARQKAIAVVIKLREMKLKAAAESVEAGVEETLGYMEYPREQWRNLRTNNPLERVIREIRAWWVPFPDGQSALMKVAARLRHIAGTKWGPNATWT